MKTYRCLLLGWFVLGLSASTGPAAMGDERAAPGQGIYADENLVAWCIVPFDAKKRGPAERAAMLKKLGITKLAYDWRQEHVATFEQEILELKKQGIQYFAFWGAHPDAFRLFEKYGIRPQVWITVPSPPQTGQQEKVEAAARQLLPLVEQTRKLGCKLGLYNHGRWGGEPSNMVAVCQYLRDKAGADHVGIVYNFHHGHGHIRDFAESFALMKPYLLCLNLNGMNDRAEPKIVALGKGQHERKMMQIVRDSGYDGPIGILDHRQEIDAEESLRENLQGLKRLRAQLDH